MLGPPSLLVRGRGDDARAWAAPGPDAAVRGQGAAAGADAGPRGPTHWPNVLERGWTSCERTEAAKIRFRHGTAVDRAPWLFRGAQCLFHVSMNYLEHTTRRHIYTATTVTIKRALAATTADSPAAGCRRRAAARGTAQPRPSRPDAWEFAISPGGNFCLAVAVAFLELGASQHATRISGSSPSITPTAESSPCYHFLNQDPVPYHREPAAPVVQHTWRSS